MQTVHIIPVHINVCKRGAQIKYPILWGIVELPISRSLDIAWKHPIWMGSHKRIKRVVFISEFIFKILRIVAFQMELNQFADWTDAEFVSYFTTLRNLYSYAFPLTYLKNSNFRTNFQILAILLSGNDWGPMISISFSKSLAEFSIQLFIWNPQLQNIHLCSSTETHVGLNTEQFFQMLKIVTMPRKNDGHH